MKHVSWQKSIFVAALLWLPEDTVAEEAIRIQPSRYLSSGFLAILLPPESVIQVILTGPEFAEVETLRIVEKTVTPGNCRDGFALHQTTRLRAIASIHGQPVDLTDMNVHWHVDSPTASRPKSK